MVLSLLFVPAVLADYPEYWDQYASGTASPGPWTYTTSMSSCFTNTGVLQLAPADTALSQPNVYYYDGASTAGCFTTSQNANLTTYVNATQPHVTVSFYYRDLVPAASNSTSWNFDVYVCGSLIGSIAVAHSTSQWFYASFTHTSVAGASCRLSLVLASVGSGSAHVVTIGIDNLYINGGNIITPSANFFLMNAQTGTWFSISNYTNSYIIVSFPSGPPVYYYNVTIPDLIINTAGASLVTVWVGNFYFATIIPAQSGANYVWLNPPNSPVLTYTLNVQDLSSTFNPGTEIFVYQGNRVMVSGYSDAENSMALWLVSGSYKVELISGANTYKTTSSFPSVSGSVVTVQILRATYENSCGGTCTISYGAVFNPRGTSVVVVFNDTALGTTYIQDSLWIRNTSGTFQLYNATTTGTFGTFQDTISCNTKACNVANESLMYVTLGFHGSDGSDSVNFPISNGGSFSFNFYVPQNFLGLDVLFPSGTTSVQAIIGYALVIACAASWGVFSARWGAVVTSILTAGLAYYGWLPIAPGVITLLVGMGVMSFIASLERS